MNFQAAPQKNGFPVAGFLYTEQNVPEEYTERYPGDTPSDLVSLGISECATLRITELSFDRSMTALS